VNPLVPGGPCADGGPRNDAVVGRGADGGIAVRVGQASGTVHVVVDVNGTFE